MSKFTRSGKTQFRETATFLRKAGSGKWVTLSKIERQTGKYIREDLRIEGANAINISRGGEIFNRYAMWQSRSDSSEEKNDAECAELVAPTNMRLWSADLSGIDAHLKPGMRAVNLFAKEFPAAEKRGRPYAACVAPGLLRKH